MSEREIITIENMELDKKEAEIAKLKTQIAQAKAAFHSIYVSVCYCDRLRDWKKKRLFDTVKFISKLAAETHKELSK